jgi:threonine aldolase
MIDLRSDTVTQPTPEMRRAMADSPVGDDYYKDDPNVTRLERMSADILGKEAALFLTSGTMGNLVAVLALTRRGDSIICEGRSHIFHNERGHLGALCGLLPIRIDGPRGKMDPYAIELNAYRDSVIYAPTRLICLENTHNAHGGCCLDEAYMAQVRDVADRLSASIHVDGARIFNAAVALKTTPAALSRHADSLTFCLSKGLACPFGSLLAGTKGFIQEARCQRQMVGGGMRQAGIMAAAGIVALQTMVDRLQEDHENARLLTQFLKQAGLDVEMEEGGTNMVFFRIPKGGPDVCMFHERLKENGVLCNPTRAGRFRMVTHYGISSDDVRNAAQAAARALG